MPVVIQTQRYDLSDKASLLAAFDKLRTALHTNDVQVLNMLIAEEYVGFDPRGNPQDKTMTVDAYKPGATKLDKYSLDGVTTSVIGSVGIVSGKGYIHGKYAEYEFEHNLRFLDIYVHREGRWQLYLSQVTPLGAV